MKTLAIALLLIAPAETLVAGADESKRLAAASTTLKEMTGMEDKSIPSELLSKAHCVVIVPGLKKGGFIIGAKYGRGFASCRKKSGVGWSSPLAMRVEGGSFGFQAGGSETDVIMLMMNESGMDKLLTSKFTLGGEASVAAGPVGRDSSAMTDAMMRAEILSYSRSRGVFGGLALNGATLRADEDANQGLYGKDVDSRKVLGGEVKTPAAAAALVKQLSSYSARKGMVKN